MFSRSTIAVGAVLAALGVLAAVALASGSESTPTTAPAPSAETDPPVQVRTKVIRRTVHVRPKASSDDDGTLDQGPGDRPQIPVTSAPAAVATVSGHDLGDDHGRHHGGDDDDFDDDNSGHGGGDDDFDDDSSGHGGGDDDSGHGRGRGRGGDDD